MSEKDKKTIIIAAVALLIFGICFLGIKPAFTNLKEAKATNTELSQQKETMKTEIESLPTYKTQLDAAKADYSKTAARIFPSHDNDELHDDIVALIRQAGLTPQSVSIGETTSRGIQFYKVDENGGIGGSSDGTVKMADISASVYGTQAQLIQFIDDLNKNEGTYIQQVSFTEGAEQTAYSLTFTMVIADSTK